jgi:hypothetical protein
MLVDALDKLYKLGQEKKELEKAQLEETIKLQELLLESLDLVGHILANDNTRLDSKLKMYSYVKRVSENTNK